MKVKLLTDGGYGDMDDAIGEIVEAQRDIDIFYGVNIFGYDLIQAGAIESTFDEYEKYYFYEDEIEIVED